MIYEDVLGHKIENFDFVVGRRFSDQVDIGVFAISNVKQPRILYLPVFKHSGFLYGPALKIKAITPFKRVIENVFKYDINNILYSIDSEKAKELIELRALVISRFTPKQEE